MTIQQVPKQNIAQSQLSEEEFFRIAKIAKSKWGLSLDSAKSPLIHSRLNRRLSSLKIENFSDYCAIIESGNSEEARHFISALTTNVTHFYRELHHFEHLESVAIPKLLSEKNNSDTLRLWSAGCSSGQEPYSLAGSVLNAISSKKECDVEIVATDVDENILRRAKSGLYPPNECSFPSAKYENRLFDSSDLKKDEPRGIKEKLRSLIKFQNLNLMEKWPFSTKLDVIMCRNVAIYFDRDTQSELWRRFSEVLVPGGYLYIGHSERIVDPSKFGLQAVGTTTYQKYSDALKNSNEYRKD